VEVRDTFSVPKIGTVAGCYVTEGKVLRNAGARLIRDGVVITKTKIASLRRFKDDAKEVAQGFECGIGLERYNDIKVGDTMEVFEIKEVAGKL
jgi:translation initiation factor IF-2